MASSLYDHPDLYDLVAPNDPAMTAFYTDTARASGPRVLDLACGSGRISVPLAQAGLEVVGGDISETMLAAASAAARKAGVRAAFVPLDMRNFDLGRTFDTVLIAANSILHLHSIAEFEGLFASVRRHLRPGGRFVFDAFVPSTRLLSLPPGLRQLVGDFSHPTHGAVRLEETIRYEPIAQLSFIDWYWSRSDRPDFVHMALEMRQIFPQEMPLLLDSAGFRLAERFGDFDRSELTGTSPRQVCIAEMQDG